MMYNISACLMGCDVIHFLRLDSCNSYLFYWVENANMTIVFLENWFLNIGILSKLVELSTIYKIEKI